jgi:hypothetical protein
MLLFQPAEGMKETNVFPASAFPANYFSFHNDLIHILVVQVQL